jgi:hypothetical protein
MGTHCDIQKPTLSNQLIETADCTAPELFVLEIHPIPDPLAAVEELERNFRYGSDRPAIYD